MKTEPDTFSIDDLKRLGQERWDGVRNFQARNNMQAMKKGDLVLIHHSGKTPQIVGLAEVVKEAYPDFTAFDKNSHYYDPKSTPDKPIWYMVDVKFKQKFSRPITLHEVKTEPKLSNMILLKAPRLSVQPVQKADFELITRIA